MREGSRHPLSVGADGIAILAGRPASPADTEDVRLARRRGYAVTTGALQPGAVGIAAPVLVSDRAAASLGVVQLGVDVDDLLAPAVLDAAAEAAKRLAPQSQADAADG
jgi:DNA-binding IclR family transcriptional regulator